MYTTRHQKATTAFENYDFGYMYVIDSDSWHTDDMDDFTKIVYVENTEFPEGDSQKVSFHVRFDNDNNVIETYGLLMSNGSMI